MKCTVFAVRKPDFILRSCLESFPLSGNHKDFRQLLTEKGPLGASRSTVTCNWDARLWRNQPCTKRWVDFRRTMCSIAPCKESAVSGNRSPDLHNRRDNARWADFRRTTHSTVPCTVPVPLPWSRAKETTRKQLRRVPTCALVFPSTLLSTDATIPRPRPFVRQRLLETRPERTAMMHASPYPSNKNHKNNERRKTKSHSERRFLFLGW